MAQEIRTVDLVYIGPGYLPDVEARDLTAAECKALGYPPGVLLASGCYRVRTPADDVTAAKAAVKAAKAEKDPAALQVAQDALTALQPAPAPPLLPVTWAVTATDDFTPAMDALTALVPDAPTPDPAPEADPPVPDPAPDAPAPEEVP